FSTVKDSGNNNGGTYDNDVIKVSDIGFVSVSTQTQTAHLTFQVANVDADGDQTTAQTLNATIVTGTNLIGKNNAESIHGTSGDDIINGAGGNDYIYGGLGNDTMTGGSGHDTFVIAAVNPTPFNTDKITDFTTGDISTPAAAAANPNADALDIK